MFAICNQTFRTWSEYWCWQYICTVDMISVFQTTVDGALNETLPWSTMITALITWCPVIPKYGTGSKKGIRITNINHLFILFYPTISTTIKFKFCTFSQRSLPVKFLGHSPELNFSDQTEYHIFKNIFNRRLDVFNTIFVLNHMFPGNSEGTRIIVGSIWTWDMIYIRLCRDSNSQPVPSQVRADSTRPQQAGP